MQTWLPLDMVVGTYYELNGVVLKSGSELTGIGGWQHLPGSSFQQRHALLDGWLAPSNI